MMNSIEQLQERLETLEHQAGRWRRTALLHRAASIVLLLAVLGVVSVGADDAPPIADVVKVKRLEIVDDAGHLVLAAASDSQGGRLDLWTPDGHNILRASANKSGGDLNIWNKTGSTVFGAFASTAGGELGIWNDKGKRMLRGAAGEHGGRFDIRNSDGQAVLAIESDKTTSAALTLSDNAGQRRMTLTADGKGSSLILLNENGQTALAAGVADSGGGFVDLSNAQGMRVLSAAAESDGCGRLDIADNTGQFVFTVDGIPDVGAIMALFNARGRKALVIGTRPEGGLMNLFNAHEVPVFVAGYSRTGLGGAISIKNGRGIPVINIASDEDEKGLISVCDADGERERSIRPTP